MNKLEYKLLTNYLEQLSFRADNSICELQLLKKHVEEFKAQISKRDNSEQVRSNLPIPDKSTVSKRDKQPSDLIRLKEVMAMTGVSRSFIYNHRKEGTFPEPIYLSERSVAWVRSSIDKWIEDKINNKQCLYYR